MKTIYALSILLFCFEVFAAGKGGVSSLIAPAFNVSLLVGAIVYFLRKPVKSFFEDKFQSISEMLSRASSKAKEAEEMMEKEKQKSLGLEDELKKLESDYASQLKEFELRYKAEVEDRIAKIKEDAKAKVEVEKQEQINKLNSNLLDLVINKAKSEISGDHNLSETATKKIIEGL